MPLAFPTSLPHDQPDVDGHIQRGFPGYPQTFAIDPSLAEYPHVVYSPEPRLHEWEATVPETHSLLNHAYISGDILPSGLPPDLNSVTFDPEPEITEVVPRKPNKSTKRKKPKKDSFCSFCRGTDGSNKVGEPEQMLSCSRCGRSGHPSCLDISHMVNVVFNYPWICLECKACERCGQKGDDTRLLFCDHCDRGWHYDCLNPPLDTAPEGKWNCEMCPPVAETELGAITEKSVVAEGEGYSAENQEEYVEVEAEEPPIASTSMSPATVPIFLNDYRPDVPQRSRPRPSTSKKKGKDQDRSHPTNDKRPTKKARPAAPGTSKKSEGKVTLRLNLVSMKGKGKGRVEDEDPGQPYDGILKPEDADTSRTFILTEDRRRFESSRLAAESKLEPLPPLVPFMDVPSTPGPSTDARVAFATPASTRPLLRSISHLLPTTPSTPERSRPSALASSSITMSTPIPPSTPVIGKSASVSTGEKPPLRIRTLRFGQWDIDTWYDAPFPEEYNNVPEGRLWMCEFCLRYMKSGFGYQRHMLKCKARHPPGDEIYRDGSISVFEVDGRKNKIYCQNLCLLSKMFLDHKSLFYDVEPFLFYVMTEVDEDGARFVGYFSKEKRSPKDYNVSCIMTLPVRQRRGWGNLLIDFSFLLSKKEARVGSPERPLSALGALSYRNYWTLAIMQYLKTVPSGERVTLESISANTAMTMEDICNTLREQNMLFADEGPKSPQPRTLTSGSKNRGRNRMFSRRTPLRKSTTANKLKEERHYTPVIPTEYDIRFDPLVVEAYVAKRESKGYLTLKPENLNWSPFLLARIRKSDFAPPGVIPVEPLAVTEDPDVVIDDQPSSFHAAKHDIVEMAQPPKPRGRGRPRSVASRRSSFVPSEDKSSPDDPPLPRWDDESKPSTMTSRQTTPANSSPPPLVTSRKRRRVDDSPLPSDDGSTRRTPSPTPSSLPPINGLNRRRSTRSAASPQPLAQTPNGGLRRTPSGRRSSRLNHDDSLLVEPIMDDPEDVLRRLTKGKVAARLAQRTKTLESEPPLVEDGLDISMENTPLKGHGSRAGSWKGTIPDGGDAMELDGEKKEDEDAVADVLLSHSFEGGDEGEKDAEGEEDAGIDVDVDADAEGELEL